MKRVRLFIGLAVTVLGPVLAQAEPMSQDQAARHVLDRLSFGPRPGDIDQVAAMGVDAWIDRQLHPERIALPADLTAQLSALPFLSLGPLETERALRQPPLPKDGAPDPEAAKLRNHLTNTAIRQAIQARLLRDVESPRQLQEVMVEFWLNHFNIFAGKGQDKFYVASFEEQAIRPNALGSFRTLLGATALHPSMLVYLDNWRNTAPGSPGAKGEQNGLNENYARELMELHTLGVDGGYDQADVISLARILTGWGLPGHAKREAAAATDGFAFDPHRHDFAEKRLLGAVIAPGGEEQGEDALDLLARSPATAHHISFQLARYFVADAPDPALVAAMTQTWLGTDGDIRAVLTTLFHSPQFWDARILDAKYKTPLQYVVSAVRAAGLPVANTRPLYAQLAAQGMELFQYQTPEGQKNTRDAWLSPDATAKRIAFATALGAGHLRIDLPPPETMARGAMPGFAPAPPARPADAAPVQPAVLLAALGPRFSTNTLNAVNGADERLRAALMLGSPEFMQH